MKVENLVVERRDNLEEMKILFNVKLDSFAARGRFNIVGRFVFDCCAICFGFGMAFLFDVSRAVTSPTKFL